MSVGSNYFWGNGTGYAYITYGGALSQVGILFGFVHIRTKVKSNAKRAIKIAAYFYTIEWFPLLFKVTQCFPEIGQYKNAFQQDAYCPLFTVRGLCPRGLCPGEGLCPEGCLSRGCLSRGLCLFLGGLCLGILRPPDRDAPVNKITGRCKKHYLARNFVCGW